MTAHGDRKRAGAGERVCSRNVIGIDFPYLGMALMRKSEGHLYIAKQSVCVSVCVCGGFSARGGRIVYLGQSQLRAPERRPQQTNAFVCDIRTHIRTHICLIVNKHAVFAAACCAIARICAEVVWESFDRRHKTHATTHATHTFASSLHSVN